MQRKHEELQQLIVHQQDELRRVSEQLLMARYGLPIVNVALPFTNVSIPPTNDNVHSSKINLPELHHHHHHPAQHHHEQNIDTNRNQSQSELCITQLMQDDQHMNSSSDLPDQQIEQNQIEVDQSVTMSQSNTDDMISYMQLTPVSSVHMQHQYSHLLLRGEENAMQSSGADDSQSVTEDFEMFPYKLPEEHEVQIVFGSTNNSATQIN